MSDRPFDPRRFLLFGVIGSVPWVLLGVILVVATGQGQWWMFTVGGLVTAAWAAARLRHYRHRR